MQTLVLTSLTCSVARAPRYSAKLRAAWAYPKKWNQVVCQFWGHDPSAPRAPLQIVARTSNARRTESVLHAAWAYLASLGERVFLDSPAFLLM